MSPMGLEAKIIEQCPGLPVGITKCVLTLEVGMFPRAEVTYYVSGTIDTRTDTFEWIGDKFKKIT